MDMWNTLAWFGLLVSVLLATGVAAYGLFIIVMLAIRWFPFFHYGRPKNLCEWRWYDRREIITTKAGITTEPTGIGSLIHSIKFRFWIGMSSPRRTDWFFGFIRFEGDKA